MCLPERFSYSLEMSAVFLLWQESLSDNVNQLLAWERTHLLK